MLPKGIRRMSGHYRNGLRTWKWHFLLVLWILLLANPRPNVLGYFLGDIKAVLNGCEDHWTLQDKAAFPLLYKMTVCVNIRVVVPGPWIAFTYSSVHGLMPELGLEGDDGALYAWLLRVKHRFPLKLSQQDWHQVCLRRDVVGSSFSLEVDQHIVGHRVVIAQAIPSYGSLWLGCGQRDQSLGPSPGQVELYLFRVWSDLDQHSSCEDGSVIGWTSEFWGVTSANARQRDNSLPCVHRRLPRHRYRRNVDVQSLISTKSPGPTTKLNCDINQLCSSNNTYFWMPVSVETEEETKSERDIYGFMSRVFNCDGKSKFTATTRSDFDIFCLDVNQIQLEKVSCLIKENISETDCGILLQLSPIVSACKLRQAGLSALQQASDKQIEATLTGEVERVGRNLCDGADASSGGFVNCSSLEYMCQSSVQTTLTCTVLKPDNVPIKPHVTTDSCGSEETHFCNCTTFCNSSNHFYAQRLNITNASIDTKFLQNMLTKQVLQTCGIKPSLQCVKALDVLQNQGLKKTYVNCQKTIQRSYSCMMTLEMTKAITDCSTISVIQTLINNTAEVTTEGPLTHMVVCGDPGKPVDTLLTSNLTWFSSNLSASDVCKVNQTHLKCAANENLAVLLSDTCPSQLTLTPLPTKTTLSTTITTPQTTTKTTVATSTQQTTSIPTTTSISTTFNTTTHPEIQTSLSTTTVPYTTTTTTTTTSAKSTNSHNTEVSTQQSTTQSLPFTSLNTTLLDTTLKTTSTQTSHHSTANSINNVTTATTLSPTQSQTTVNDTTTATTFSSSTNEVSKTTTANPTTASTVDKITTLLTTSNKAELFTTTSSSTPATTANTTDTTTASTIVDRTTIANTASTTTANRNYTTTINNMGDMTKVSSTPTTDTIDTTTANNTISSTTISITVSTTPTANVLNSTTKANTASTTTANRNYTTTINNMGDMTKVSSTTTTDTIDTTTANNTISSTTISITVSTTPRANVLNSTTNANTASTTTANRNYTTTVNNMSDTTKVSSTTTTDTIDTTTASTIVDNTTNAITASTTTANRNYTTTANDVGNTAKVSSTTTTSTIDTTTASNTISSTTISITVSTTPTANILNSTTSGSTASSTTTANRNNTATTANILNGTSSGSTASSTTTANRNNTATTAITVDHSTEENTASTTTPNSIDNSTKTTIAKIVTGTTEVNTADSTTMSRTVTTAAPTVNSTAKTISTSSYTVHTTLMASTEDNTTKVSSTTTSSMVYNATTASTYTISGQTIVNNASTTSGMTTNATSPTVAPNLISTMSHATTIETLTTSPSSTGLNTTTPFSSTTSHVTVYNTTMVKSSQPNTTFSNTTHFNETLGMISIPMNGTTGNASTTASPLASTQSTNTPSTSLPNTTTEETSTNAANQSVSESTTIEATHSQVTMANVTTAQTYTSTPGQPTKDVTTPVPHSTSAQQNTQSISTTTVGTTLSESTITHNGTTESTTPNSVTTADALTQYSKIFNVTSPTTVTTTSNHSLVLGSNTTEAITQSPDNVTMTSASINSTTTTATSVSSVTQDTTDLQGSTITTTYTTMPTSAMEYNVTTSRNISITATSAYNETEVNRMLNITAVRSNMSSTTTTPMSNVASTTFTTTKATVSTFTTPYNPNYNVTKTKEKSDTPTTRTTTTSTTAYTPLVNHTAGYNVTKSDHNDTKKSNISTTAMPSLNITVTSLPNYTLTYNATTKGSTYTTIALENTTSISQNTTGKVDAKVAVTTEPQIATTLFESTTAATQVSNVTLTQNTTIASVTTIYANVTKPTLAPLGNFTANLTTPSMSNMTVADLNGTVPTTSFTPISNQTTLSGTDDITTTSTMKTDLTSTTEVTTLGAVLSSQPTTTPTNTTTAAATTTGPQPTQDRTDTTTEVPPDLRTTFQTSTTSGTATTKPGSMTTKQTTRTQQELEEEANNLLSQTESRLNSSQVSKLVGQLESLLDGPTVSQAVGKKAINIISNLMEGDAQALSASANRLIRLVDGLGVKLVVSGENEILSSTSLVLAVQTVNGSNFRPTTVHIHNTDNVQLNHGRAKLTGAPLGSVFLPSSLTEGLSPDQQHRASRVHFTFYTKNTLFQDATLNNQTITSPVLGTSVASLPISNLREHVQFTIRNVNPINTNHSTSCVFWDFTVNGGAGGWNNAGCHVVNATPEDTTCSCNHLTSFAVLLDLSREGVTDRQQAQILTFITYIGCGISAVFLSITILTYITFEKLLRDIPAKILVQLCISLLFLNLVFLMDGWLALYKLTGLCISTAFFLHYFLLTSFTWAGLEALHMYLSIVRVFTPYLSQYMMKFSIMGWGIPLIVVVIIVAVDRNNYGLVSYGKYTDGTTDDFCWLRNNTAFYVGVVAYFLLIFVLCLIVFIVVLVQLARIKRQNPQNQSPNRGVLSDLRSISGLVILLGLTWGFALFAWGPLYLPFVYLFSIFNSLQGFFVFVFHCAVKENVQRQWRTYLCCGKLRLAENSEWSRTATHTNKNVSFAMMSSSATHLTSSSASVISETNSSGSVYAESGISDSSNSDVVMNEIHRRSMALQGNL